MSRNQRRNRRNKSGSNQSANRDANRGNTEDRSARAVLSRPSTETKSSLRTTELIAYAAAVLAVIMTALAVDADVEGGTDPFGADSAIRYITYLTIGYMIARGLAKSGSFENRVERDNDPADHDASRAEVTHEADPRDDDRRDSDSLVDERDGDVEVVDAVAVPSEEVRHTERGNTAARP